MAEKVLLIVGANAYPPNPSGASSILYNLLNGIDPAAINVLTGNPAKSNSNTLPFENTRISSSQLARVKLLWRFQFLENILHYVWDGLTLTARKKYSKILLVFPDTSSFLAGYFVARLRRLNYQVYLIDLLSDSRLNKVEWALLRLFERRILKKARIVYALSQGIVDFYKSVVPRDYLLLPHCITLNKTDCVNGGQNLTKRKTIVFSGQIHEISLDALQNLIRAVRLIDEFDVTVQIFTNRSENFLREKGLLDDFVETGFISDAGELLLKLQEADILFSPVAFKPRYPNQAMTCFPTKTFDYIQARRPILVHAPADYFYNRYMAEHGGALCVTSFDPKDLKDAIINLFNGVEMQRNLVESAVIMVEKYHNKKEIQERLVCGLFGKD